MKIENITLFTSKNQFEKGEIHIQDGKISSQSHDDLTIDGSDLYAIPGLIDLHFHGCMGYDFCDGTEEALENIAKHQVLKGITSICPATMTLPVEELVEILTVAANYKKRSNSEAEFVGVNMEGPFISELKKGAQNSKYIIPIDEEIVDKFIDASNGLAKFIAVAPEKNDRTYEFIENVKNRINVTLAHTNASYDQATKAFESGANHVVHLYNAMPLHTHRDPNVVGALYDQENVTAELICDLVHVHPSVVRTTFKILGSDRVILISDTMRAAGLDDGEYTLGGLDVTVTGNKAVLSGSDVIAGSVTNLMDCMRIAIKEIGIPFETAVQAATVNPAKKLGIYDKCGSLDIGKNADIVILDKNLNIKYVLKHGEIVFSV